jgi:uncharacterized membrane protein
MVQLIKAIPSKKTAAVIVSTAVSGVFAFALIEPTKYAIAATGIILLSSIINACLIED